MKGIHHEMKSTKWKKALAKKILQKQLAQLCGLMSPYAYASVLRKLIESKDPWLWLAGHCFIGIDPYNHEGQLNALFNDDQHPDNYIDQAQFLESLDQLVKSSAFQKIYKNYVRQEQQLAHSLLEYIKDLNKIYSKLMVIRLDLSYGEIYTTDWEPERRVLNDWELFHEYAADAFKDSFIGYAAKFEYGADKGIHIHTLLFFDGSVVRQDVSIAKHLGKHWKNTITQGAGIYFNANTLKYKARMKHCAVGVFKRSDANFLIGAKEIAKYFAKKDPIVRLAVPGLTQTLRRSSPTLQQKAMLEKRGTMPLLAQVIAQENAVCGDEFSYTS
ncbi:inovirus Gp2 family protein [Diaphorobacter sp. HDW4A]|uniref:YagK/YfjJ domain-containing protein n=1 Tax=Diaphorobacter sp. HDW4A TaxID=2714924 RepID=UPI00140B953F|nr:inovirus-type Gp2 protein [Diaphorobacter sp. HDW4A]QIL80756.1 inovirus Gp2 family protein [Diaphorobacter sp. HDW4A]